jgi:hypothetical protein
VSCQTADAFVPKDAWARLPAIQRFAYQAVLRIPVLRDMGKLMRFRFGA